jgi:GT2 family glycosyltransferase
MNSQVYKTAILIPVFNKLNYTQKCLKSLDAIINGQNLQKYFTIVLIDDGSKDQTREFVETAYPFVHILNGDGNLWWSGSINVGALYAKDHLHSDYLLLWNNDIICEEIYFQKLVDLQKSLNGNQIIGSKIYMDNTWSRTWSTGGKFHNKTGDIYMIGYDKPDVPAFMKSGEIEWIPGMGTLIPTSVIDKIGLWDHVNFPQYHGDLEFTYRAYLNGYKLVIDPELKIANDTTNSNMKHEGNFKNLLNLFVDKRSLYNFRVNTTFIKKYGEGPFKYSYLIKFYTILLLSFMKHSITRLFRG